MADISIRTNFPDIARQLRRVTDDVGNKAMVRALNTTIKQGQAEMARAINREYRLSNEGLSIDDVRERLKIKRASARRGALALEAKLEVTRRGRGRSINLINFVVSNRNPARGRQLGFRIKRRGGIKHIPGAFIANKGRTVFVRTGRKRLPIEPVSTIDVPQMFNARRVNSAVRAKILARFQINFDRELRAVMRGFV
jgi:hypothetical protein